MDFSEPFQKRMIFFPETLHLTRNIQKPHVFEKHVEFFFFPEKVSAKNPEGDGDLVISQNPLYQLKKFLKSEGGPFDHFHFREKIAQCRKTSFFH